MVSLKRRRAAGLALTAAALCCANAVGDTGPKDGSVCIAPLTYLPLDAREVGADENGTAVLGTYERVSPDGRFILRSYSGARLGKVSLMELPESTGQVKVFRTPLANEAFPVQGTWRYLVDVTGEHYRFGAILKQQTAARPLFKGGMTGFYAAASELNVPIDSPSVPPALAPTRPTILIRSLSWPQNADPDAQGVGPLQLATIEVEDDGKTARLVRSMGPTFICGGRLPVDGNVYALPMLSVDGTEFSAIPQVPRSGQPSMRVYGLAAQGRSDVHPCDLRADLGFSPSKAVSGFAQGGQAAWLTYSDLGNVYVHDRASRQTFRMDQARHRVLASAFPGLTRDGRVIYGATWRDCADARTCPEQTGYVVADPYQSQAWREHWRSRGQPMPKACITQAEVAMERERFARFHDLPR